MVTFVTRYPGMKYEIFLVIANRRGFLLNAGDTTYHLCPCCLYPEHQLDIKRAVNKVMDAGLVDGRICWVSTDSQKYGARVAKYGFNQNIFCHGTIEEVPPELLAQAQCEVLNHAE